MSIDPNNLFIHPAFILALVVQADLGVRFLRVFRVHRCAVLLRLVHLIRQFVHFVVQQNQLIHFLQFGEAEISHHTVHLDQLGGSAGPEILGDFFKSLLHNSGDLAFSVFGLCLFQAFCELFLSLQNHLLDSQIGLLESELRVGNPSDDLLVDAHVHQVL